MNDITAIADRFLSARRSAAGLEEYPGEFPDSLEEAYAIQDAAIARWGKPVIGWKVGRIPAPLSDKLGIDRLAGPIFEAKFIEDESTPDMPVFGAGFAAGEAEFLLRIGTLPPPQKLHLTLEEAADLIDVVRVGIEIASSPLGAINRLGPLAIISDFGNNNGLAIGREIPNWRSSGFEDWLVTTQIDDEEAGTGQAALFPNGAIGSAVFLFELMSKRGIELQPGQWISSGAVGGVHSARPGQLIEARFGDFARVSCRLTAVEPLKTKLQSTPDRH